MKVRDSQESFHNRRLALDAAGVVGVDHACSDWTRHYRVARCMRKGHYDPPWWDDLTRMVPIDPPSPVGAVPRQRKAAQGSVGHRPAVEPLWSVDVPPVYRELVADLGAVVATVDDEWHRLFLAISGALLERGVPPEHVPAIVGGASVESKRDDRPDSRYAGAQTTVRRWQENLVFKGFTTLQKLEPRVAAVVARHTATAPEQRVQGQIDQARVAAAPASPIETATLGIRRTIASAFGLVAIEAGCGVGKSQAALAVAEERSKKTAKSEDATSGRAPTGSKTAISCPTHALAIQHTQNLRRRGVAVMRVFGPLSVMREDGTPECRHHEAGVGLHGDGDVHGGVPPDAVAQPGGVDVRHARARERRRLDHQVVHAELVRSAGRAVLSQRGAATLQRRPHRASQRHVRVPPGAPAGGGRRRWRLRGAQQQRTQHRGPCLPQLQYRRHAGRHGGLYLGPGLHDAVER
jgi:hypothetical protein